MAGRIGYNLSKIQDAMDDIKENYDKIGRNITKDWADVVGIMQSNWVGEDEQNYEATLAKKINSLYEFAAVLANAGMETLYNAGKQWYDGQKNNLLENSEVVANSVFNLQINKAVFPGNIIERKVKEIGVNEDRGLVNDSSKENIKGELEKFKEAIKSQVKGLIDLSTIDKAFFGTQVSSIKSFVEKVNESMGEVLSAFNDLYQALEGLAGTSYDTLSGFAEEEMTTSSSSIDSAVDSTGGRWQ